jgi:flagellar hook-associated protein 3 FlgL
VSTANQQALAEQVQSIQSQIVQLANTSYQGSYLFGGTATQSAPFTLDSTQPSGVLYSGNTGVNNVEIAPGTASPDQPSRKPGIPGRRWQCHGFTAATGTALQSGNTTSIGTATTQVSTALNYLSQQRVFYGSGISQLNSNQSYLQQEQVNLQTQENTWWAPTWPQRRQVCLRRRRRRVRRWRPSPKYSPELAELPQVVDGGGRSSQQGCG